ncbi:hypothetical protein E2562_035346 [Oryza meyeriana var. granulata]|uniref:Uncharacterized protein n=1 Tax=Oryza meyeriana var. granulata TaxID=110450 RepID=A0A6G1ESJ5_9ORYZ|nr:hypothetical protein E2562_035346 [Oryza meyeriana var. granulata]
MEAAVEPSSWDKMSSAHVAFSRTAGNAVNLSMCMSGHIAPASTMIALFSSQINKLSSAVTPCSCSSGSVSNSSVTSGCTTPAAAM